MLLAVFMLQRRVNVVARLWSRQLSLGTPSVSRDFRITALPHYRPVFVNFEAHNLLEMHV